MDSFCHIWGNLTDLIKSKLSGNQLGTFGVSVGFLDREGTFPVMIPLQNAFSTLQNARRATVIVVSSFNDCKKIGHTLIIVILIFISYVDV